MKKTDEAYGAHLGLEEIQALLDAPDPRTVSGTRDRAMLHITFAAGLRVSELIGLHLDHVDQRHWASIHVMGKGRRERILPLWKETAAALKAWISIRPATAEPELFPNSSGHAMTRSGSAYILAKHAAAAAKIHSSIAGKRVTPHVLRHSCAMHTLKATRDIRQVSLWLGHASLQSTEIYRPCGSHGKARSSGCNEISGAQTRPVPGAGQSSRDAQRGQTRQNYAQ